MISGNVARRIAVTGLASLIFCFTNSIRAQTATLFSGLPYEENFIREKIAQYSIRADSTDASWEIPTNLLHQLVFKEILADKNLQARIGPADLQLITNLPAPWDHSFLVKDHAELGAICAKITDTDSSAKILHLATRFDNSRARKERDLDNFYVAALNKLTAESRKIVQDLIADFTASKKIAYAAFDMAGFAEEVPEAAKVILVNGCKNFNSQLSTYKPETVKLGDL